MSGELREVLLHPLFLGALGAVIGSFLNVVIWRLPRRQSLVSPGSRCPNCGTRIAPWDNIPVVSWLLLQGKCRKCRGRISARYPVVEALTALLFFIAGSTASSAVGLLFTLVFVSAMVVVTFVDLDHMIIPDIVTLPGMGLGLAGAFAGAGLTPKDALVGALVGGGSLFVVGFSYRAVTGRDGLGGGDVKLLGMVGAFLGPLGAFLTIMIGSLAGTLFAIVFMLRTGRDRKAELPFGTFLAPGAVLVLFLGGRIVEAYLGFFS
jgi:leader peptidase (prepilin peptidase)/N-methyltransferase